MTVEGRVALVTGGGSGIGQAIAMSLAKNGAKVAVVDISKKSADSVADTIRQLGREAISLECDVASKENCQNVVQATVEKWGKLDILVNCAGILFDAPLKKLSEEDWDRVQRVNLKGTLFCIQAALGPMSQQRYGRIVNIGSAAYLGNAYQAAYSTAKAGVASLTKVAALELARNGITVNCVAPGLVETPMTQGMPKEAKEKLAKSIPGGRLGLPEDIAHIVLALAADEAGYTTGQIIIVDGGLTTALRA